MKQTPKQQRSIPMHAMQAVWRRMPEGPLAAALQQAAPIVLGYIPVGFAYGVLAQKAGLAAYNTLFMSLIVFAGSAQLIAVGLLSAGAAPLAIVLTTFIVNLRHLLMSAALSPHLKRWKPLQIAVMASQLTDETFAVHTVRFANDNDSIRETLAINAISHSAWVGGTWLGLAASGLITDVRPFGLDYALPAMFLALLVAQVRSRTHLIVAVTAAFLAMALFSMGCTQWHVILATLAAASIGLAIEMRK